jgi:K+-transporting ATPase KdpF subunit
VATLSHDGSHLHRCDGRDVSRRATVRPLVRETLNYFMENIIVGLIALALFAYLVIAMVYPEKF